MRLRVVALRLGVAAALAVSALSPGFFAGWKW
jgi:hypothetical protein